MPIWIRLALVASIALGALTLVEAQDDAGVPPPEPPPVEAADDTVEAITGPTADQLALLEATHLAELAQRTRIALRDARPLLREPNDIGRIAHELPAAEALVAQMITPARLAQIPTMSQRELADHRQVWRAMRGTYEDWQSALADNGNELETVRTPLVDLRRTWRAFRDAVIADRGEADSRLPRIEATIETVRDATNQLEARRDSVESLEDRVGEFVIQCEDVGDDMREAQAAYRERLFVRDRLPLWDGLGSDTLHADEPAWGDHVAAQLALLHEHADGMARLAVLVIVLAILIELMRRRAERDDDQDVLAEALAIGHRRVAAAMVLGLLLAAFVVPNAPVFFYDCVAVAIVAPIAWLLWPILPPSQRAFVGIVAAAVVADRIEGTMPDGLALRRAAVLAESIVFGGALGAWLQRESANQDRTTRQAWNLALILGFVLGAAFVANVLGYAFLATVLVRGTAFALGGALSLATALRIFDALAVLVVAMPVAKNANAVRLHRALILARLHRGIVVVLSLTFVVLLLGGYGLATPFFVWLDETLHAHGSFGTLDLSLGEVFGAALVLTASWMVMRFVIFVLELDVLPRLSLEPGVGGAISGLTRYLLFGLGLVLAMATLGIDASQIALVAGALGVGVGFGLQGIVANFIAGLVLMLERPVRLGDRIDVGQLTGRVERIGLRSSTIRGDDGAEVIVPNETLIGREVVNWTLSDRRRRIQIDVGVAYGTDPRKVLDVAVAAVLSHPGVLTKAKGGADPAVRFVAFGASSLDFAISFWTAEHDQATQLKSEVGILVLDALTAAGIEIPFPQQDVRILSLPKDARP